MTYVWLCYFRLFMLLFKLIPPRFHLISLLLLMLLYVVFEMIQASLGLKNILQSPNFPVHLLLKGLLITSYPHSYLSVFRFI